ncbi:MAG: DUF3794 and LysM peptidoglycan-binding domain-containing protein [Bacillota bacterium]
MELYINKEKVHISSLLRSIDEEISCEAETAFPASLGAVNRIICSFARLRGREINMEGNRLTIRMPLDIEAIVTASGSENPVSVIWSPESGDAAVCTYETEVPGLRGDDVVWAKADVQSMQLVLGNNGKAGVRARIALKVKVFRTAEGEIMTDASIASGARLDVAKEDLTVYDIQKEINLDHEWERDLYLPGHMPEPLEVLMKEAIITDSSITAMDGRIAIKGAINLGIVYRTNEQDSGQANIMYHAWTKEDGSALPFESVMDIAGLRSNSMVEACLEVDRISCTVNSHGLHVAVRLRTQGLLLGAKSLSAVTDIAAPEGVIMDVERRPVRFANLLGKMDEKVVAEKTLNLPERLPQPEKVIDARVKPVNVKIECENDQARITGNLQVTMLYMAARGEEGPDLVCYEWEPGEYEFVIAADAPGCEEREWENLCLTIHSMELRQGDEGKFDLSTGVSLAASFWNSRDIMTVSDAALVLPRDESCPRPTFLYYVVQRDDTLWKIARRYNTTVEQIAQTNNIPNLDLPVPGERILIPARY